LPAKAAMDFSKIRGSILDPVSDLSARTPDTPGTPALLSQEIRNMSLIARFLRDDAGATAIEYGLIAAGISVAIIATVAGIGPKLNTTFTKVSDALN
jgi:pilus assembly protein Flp/PilA